MRVGIDCGDDAAGDAGGDKRVGAGSGAAVVRAGFEGNVSGCAANVVAASGSVFEGGYFGVVACVVEVCAFAEGFVAACEHAADGWIGRSETDGVACEL